MTNIYSNNPPGESSFLPQSTFSEKAENYRTSFNPFELLSSAPQFRDVITDSVRQNNVIISQMPCRQPKELAECFNKIRESLLIEAEDYFHHFAPAARHLPDLTPEMSDREMIEQIFRINDGLIIGENHASTKSKQLLADNMETLSRCGVKTLYIEGLMSDIHQSDLDVYFSGLHNTLPCDVATFLENATNNDSLASFFNVSPPSSPRYTDIVIAAKEQGIKVVAIDCSTTYLLSHQDSQRETSFPYTRILMMNFFAGKVIEHYQAQSEAGKYVVFAGDSHISSTRFDSLLYPPVAGLAEITGAVSIDIKETGANYLYRGIAPELHLQDISLCRLKYVVNPDFTLTR